METEINQVIEEVDPAVEDTAVVDTICEDATDATASENKADKKKSKPDVKKFIKFFLILNLLSFIRAFSMHCFIIPNGFAPGGISGLASLLYNAIFPSNPELAQTWFNPALISWVFNIPLFIASFFRLDKRFCINTMITVGLLSLWMWVLEIVNFPVFKATGPESAYNLLAATAGGICTGISLGFLLRHNSSMGGTDIIGKLIYKKNPVADVQWIIIACDTVVVMASGVLGIISIKEGQALEQTIASVLSPIFYSAVSLFVCAETADVIQSGFKSSIVFNVISDHHDDIARAIGDRLVRGVTMVHATGWYTGIEHDMLVCVVRKKQINQVNDIIKEFDPEAFVYITKAKDVSGKGFTYHSAS